MNPLPVIQPPSEARPVTQAQSTSAMIADPQKTAELTPPIVQALSTVFDPEIPVNIYELGLIYEVIVDIVWDPPWDRDRMSEAARLQLGL